MAQRVLKPSICTSEDINRLSFFEEVMFYRMIVSADDRGRLDGRPEILKSNLFPLKRDITLAAIRKAITNMSTVGLVIISEEGGRPILKLTKWECHQRIRSTSDHSVGEEERDSAAKRGAMRRDAAQNEKETKKEKAPPAPPYKENKKEKEKQGSLPMEGVRACACEGFVPPSLDDVREFIVSERLSVNPDLWYAHYSANGWTVGGVPMRDWKGSVKSWHIRGDRFGEKKTGKTNGNGGITESSFDGNEFLSLALRKGAEQ